MEKQPKLRVLMLSLDPLILDPDSVPALRIRCYAEAIDHLSVVIPTQQSGLVTETDALRVYGSGGGNKVTQLLRTVFLLRTIIRTQKISVVTTQDFYYLGLVCVLLSKFFTFGLEVQVHGIEKYAGLRKRLAGFVFKRADVIRVVSSRVQQKLQSDWALPTERFHLVSVYVATEQLQLDTAIDALPDTAQQLHSTFESTYKNLYNLVTVGRLVPAKHIALQIQAVAVLAPSNPMMHLHIVGEGPMQSELTTLVETLGISNRVTFYGRLSGAELGVLYRSADLFLLTSDHEGYGMVVVEAAAAKLPIIMTDVGCAGDFIKSNENGVVIPVGDSEAAAAAIQALHHDPARAQRLADAAYASYQALGTFDAVIAQYRAGWQRAADSVNK